MTKQLRHLVLFLTFNLFSITFLQAQYYQERYLSLGLSFNPNISWLSYEDADTYRAESKIGYSYGLVADLGFSPNYYFATGLQINTLYSTAMSATGTDGTMQNKQYRLQYAEVPLAIKLKTNEGRNGGIFYGLFGFTAGLKVSGKESLDEGSTYTAISGDDIFRLGLQVGAGSEWRLSSSLFAKTGVTYNNGFTRTMKEGSPRLSYLSLNIGLLF